MILATVDIEDLATPKLAGVRSALAETAQATRQYAADAARASDSVRTVGQAYADQAARVASLTEGYRSLTPAQAAAASSSTQLARAQETVARSTGIVTSALSANTMAWQLQLGSLNSLVGGLMKVQTVQAGLERNITALGVAMDRERVAATALVQAHAAHTKALEDAGRATTAYNTAIEVNRVALLSLQKATADLARVRADVASGTLAGANAERALAKATAEQAAAQKAAADAGLAVGRAHTTVTEAAQKAAITTGYLRDAELKLVPATEAVVAAEQKLATTHETVTTNAMKLTNAQKDLALKMHQLGTTTDKNVQEGIRNLATGFEKMTSAMTPGATVTGVMATQLKALGVQAKDAGVLIGPLNGSMRTLLQSFKPGATVTKTMATAFDELRSGVQGFNSVIPPAAQNTQMMTGQLAAMTAALATLTAGLGMYLSNAVQVAARNEVLGVVMGIVARNSSNLETTMKGQVEAMKAYGITTQAATEATIDFAQANLDVADASKLALAARDLATVAGKSVAETMSTLTRAIQTQQVMSLRQFGIVKNMSQVYSEYATQIGKTKKELDGLDRQQAVLNMILKEGEQVAGSYEASISKVAKAQTLLTVKSEELSAKLGEKLLPAQLTLIKIQESLLDAALGMPDWLTAVAAAAGVAAVAITAVGTAITGAKLVGLGTLLSPVLLVLKDFAIYFRASGLAAETFAATAASATAAMGPLGLALGAIVLVLAAVAAAYVYVTAKQQEYINAGKDTVAQVAKTQTEVKNYVETLEGFKRVAAETEAEKIRLKEAIEGLNKILPGSARLIDAETSSFNMSSEAIAANTQELQANARARIQVLRAERVEVQEKIRIAEETAKRSKQIAESNRSTMGVGAAAAGAGHLRAGAEEQMIDVHRQRLEVIDKLLKENAEFTVEGRLDKVNESRRLAIKALDAGWAETGMDLGKAMEKVGRADAAGKALVEKIRGFDKQIAEAKKLDDPTKMPDPAAVARAYGQLGDTLTGILAEEAKKAEKAGDKFQRALQSMRERIAGETTEMRAQAQALNEELTRIFAIKDTTEQTEALDLFERRFGSMVKSLGVNVQDLADDAPLVKDFFDKMQANDLANWAESIKKNLHESVVAVETAFEDMRIAMDFEYAEKAYAQQQDLVKARRETAQEIYEIDQELYEQQVVQYMSAGDQQIYAEKKRITDLQRAFDLEQTMREEAYAEQARQLEQKIEQQKQETLNLARNVRVRTDLRRMEMEHAIKIDKDMSAGAKAERLAEIDAAHLQFGRLLEEQVQYNLDAIEADAERHRALLDQQRAGGAEMTALQKAALDRQKAQHEANIKEVIKASEAGSQVLKAVWGGLADGVMTALTGILNQTMTWKEAFISIWKSLQSALNSVWQSMLKNWIDTATQMATKGGGFDIKALVSGLLGRGQRSGSGVGAGGAGGQWGGTAAQYGMQNLSGLRGFFGGMGASGGTIGVGVGAGAAQSSIAGINGMAATGAGLVAKGPGIYRAGSGFAKSAVGGAMLGGAVGGIVGTTVAQRYADGSYARGVLSGAASGAAAGSVGGWWGAAAGGIMGAVGGYFAARKQRQQVKTDRAEIIQNAGGMEQLKVQAEAAGVNIDKFLSTKRVKEFQTEVKKLNEAFQKLAKDQMIVAAGGEEMFRQAAFEAGHFEQATIDAFVNGTLSAERMREVMEKMQKDLELKEAKDSLAKTVSQMDELRKVAVLAGYDLQKLYDAKTIEEFNAQQAQLNKLLEEQQLRLDGLNTAAQGLTLRVQGLAMSYTKGLEAFVTGLGKEQQDAWKKLVEGTKEGEKSLIQRLREAMADAKGGAVRVGDLDLSSKQAADLAAQFEKVQKAVNNIGGAAAATFGGILRETGSISQAMAAVNEPLDMLNQILQETGAEAPAALHHLLSLRSAVQANQDVVTSLEGINMMLKGLSDAGQLTETMFNDLGRDAAAQWEEMKARGVAEDQALLMMQPTLQALYEAQKNFGFATDDATGNLIEMGRQQGLVGDQFQSINQKMLDMLMIIAEAVGGTVPEAYRAQTDAQKEAARAAAEAVEQQRVAAEAAAAEQQRIQDETERTRLEYDLLARTDMGDLAQQAEDVHSQVEPLAGAAEVAAGKMTELSDVEMEQLLRQLEEAQQAAGMEEGGLGKTAVVAKDKLNDINDVSMGAIQGAMLDTKDAAYKIEGGAAAATAAILAMVANTAAPLDEMAGRIDRLSLGQSPGGLKEIKIQAESGEAAIRSLGRATIAQAMAMDRAINSIDASANADNALAAAYANQTMPRQSSEAPPAEREPAPVNNVQVTFNVPVAFNTLDPSKASDAWELIRPGFETALRSNTKQIGTLVEDAARRHRRKVQA